MPQRRPRVQRSGYLAWIRSFPCLICGTDWGIEAAHIRYTDLPAGKRITGVGNKPHDAWTVPLCQRHHTWGEEAQHNAMCSERDWWVSHGIDPVVVAALLFFHFIHDDRTAAEQVVAYARRLGR